MQDKLYLLDNLTLEQVTCAVLGIESAQENASAFNGYLRQLCSAAESEELKSAAKAREWVAPPLMGGNYQNSKPIRLEYSGRSTVPRVEVISYLRARGEEVPRCFIDGIESSKLSKEDSEQVADLKAANLKLHNELVSIKASLENSKVEKLEACSQVTFGAVCVLLAKYGAKDGRSIFNSPGFNLESPKANASAISEEIKNLASEMVDVKVSDAGGADNGFKDTIRREAISNAFSRFECYISEAAVDFIRKVTENNNNN